MASLTAQMEALKKQQTILAEKIRQEEERKRKLDNNSSIERLEALIQPITQYLDRRDNCMNRPDDSAPSLREGLTRSLKKKEETRIMKNESRPFNRQIHINNIKYNHNHMLANEEIFVTLLGIIKKQDARIEQLEKGNKVDNTHLKRASTIEFSDLQMMKRY